MKSMILSVWMTLALGTAVEAALPPLYQTAAEIKSMMADEQLGQKLQSGEAIMTIQKTDAGYEIVTNQHRLQVEVNYEPAKQPGPAKFKLQFGDPVLLLTKP